MLNKNKLVPFFLLLLTVPFSTVNAKDNSDSPQAHELMQAFLKASGSPGLSVSVGYAGKIVWPEGFGHADLGQGVSVDPATTRFNFGTVLISLGEVFVPE